MFKKNPVKAMQRLLREFPWLWAIKDDWDSNRAELRVRYAHELENLWRTPSPSNESLKVWVHLKDDTGRERVVPLRKSGSGTQTLAREVYITAHIHEGFTQHVVIVINDTIDVLREPGCGQEPIRSFDKYMEMVGCF